MLKSKHAITAALIAGLALMATTTLQAAPILNFTGPYDFSNWNQSIEGNGSIDTSGAPFSVVLTGPDGDDPLPELRSVDFTFTAITSGTVSFAWSFMHLDLDQPDWDPFGFLLAGVFTQLTDDLGASNQSGVSMFQVTAGEIFGFRQASVDSYAGAAATTISAFSAPGVNTIPVPGAIWLFGLGIAGLTLVRRRRI